MTAYQHLKNPARLYIKQCPHCGLKYFGVHKGKNVERYAGSGKYWKRHLKKHQVKPVHLWNSDWYYDTKITKFALKFSKINKIVESHNWANDKDENGVDGGDTKSGLKCYNNGKVNSFFKEGFQPEGWTKGRWDKHHFTSEIQKQKLSNDKRTSEERSRDLKAAWVEMKKNGNTPRRVGYPGDLNPMRRPEVRAKISATALKNSDKRSSTMKKIRSEMGTEWFIKNRENNGC